MSDPFAQPPEEVTRYLKSKGVRPSGDWREFSFDEHATAFTVARSAGYDILGDIKGALEKAIRDREDFETFRKRLKPVLQAKGWWGVKETVDPATGETKVERLGSTRRLRTIYWANTRTAYGAGQWERAQRTKRVLPFFVYVISTAEQKRQEHLEWVGTVLPVDDPWWDDHYPPSAWGCMCRVRQISDYEAGKLGYDPGKPPPGDGLTYAWTNARTGEVVRVPLGVDPGWGRNPGKTRLENVSAMLAGKLDAMDAESRRIAVEDMAGSWLVRRMVAGELPYDPNSRDPANVARGRMTAPIAVLPDALGDALGATTRVARLSVADAAKQHAQRRTKDGELSVPAEAYPIVQGLIDRGEVIRQGEFDLAIQGVVDGKPWLVILRRAASAPDEVYVKSFHRIEPDDFAKNRARGIVVRGE